MIDFDEMSEADARRWPDLFSIIEAKVKPERMRQNDKGAKELWWRFIRPRPELRQASRNLERLLVISRDSDTCAFTFLSVGTVLSEKIVVFPEESYAFFALLQSRAHEIWARMFSTTLKDDLQYTPSRCFDSFPFPDAYESSALLERKGREYYEFRAELMVKNNEGLTKTYNRFHDRRDTSHDIVQLREFHDAVDREVLKAYGSSDIRPVCQFLPVHQSDDAEKSEEGRFRYRWPDEIRDEVLARLLVLNAQRAEEERLAGPAADGTHKTKPRGRRAKRVSAARALFQAVGKPEA